MKLRLSGCIGFLGSVALLSLVTAVPACAPTPRTDCNDGIDNDGDGFVDDLDPGCSVNGDLEAPDPVECSDGFDNDGDGFSDCYDDECAADPACPGEILLAEGFIAGSGA